MKKLTVTQTELDALNKFTNNAKGFTQSDLLERLYNNVNFFTDKEADLLKELISKYSMTKFESLFHLAIDDESDDEYTLVIEEPFKVGDWVVQSDVEDNKIFEVRYVHENAISACCPKGSCIMTNVNNWRKATPDEIAQEKERRKWAEIGRKPGEYKINDFIELPYEEKRMYGEIKTDHGYGMYGVVSKYGVSGKFPKEKFTLICPAEQRFDKEHSP